jgi:single-strand DNA-binding protein
MAEAVAGRPGGRQRRATSRPQPAPDTDGEVPAHVNEVRLVGRLAITPVRKDLPSGDPLVSFRLVVERDPKARRAAANGGSSRSPTVDTLDCSAWRRDVQRTLARAEPGEVLEISGAIRRRFWRTGTGAASRSEVEVLRVRRVG